MPADVDVDLFDKLSDAIDYVAQSGGGAVRVYGQTDTTKLYWKSLVDLAEKRGVKIELVSMTVPQEVACLRSKCWGWDGAAVCAGHDLANFLPAREAGAPNLLLR